MCTVTYLPVGPASYLLTSNRDESPKRKKAVFPVHKQVRDKNILFPKDQEKGGTWIATSDHGVSIVLLNGAFEKHKHNPPYRVSRGLMVLEAIECIRPDEFVKNYNFNGIEPFTMIFAYYDPTPKVIEFRWDGKSKYLATPNPEIPHIWASATLYNKEQQADRKTWFKQWLSQNSFTPEAIRQFHSQGGFPDTDPENALKMHRPGQVSTLSISTIQAHKNQITFIYEDLTNNSVNKLVMAQELSWANAVSNV